MELTAEDFYLLFCNRKFKKVIEPLADDLTGMYFVLRILQDNKNELLAGDISSFFGVSTARTAVVLKTLSRKGYVKTFKSILDRRKTIVRITEKGIAVLNARTSKIIEKINEPLSKLSEEEKISFYQVLSKILN